jgi:predicted YcjX-like family ATPase
MTVQRQALIDRVALALVRRMLTLSGQIKGKHYTDEPHPFVVTVRGEEKTVGYEEALALSPHWRSMAEASIEAMTEDRIRGDECKVKGLLGAGSRTCSKCHAVFPGDVPDPCPACAQIAEIGKMIAESGK